MLLKSSSFCVCLFSTHRTPGIYQHAHSPHTLYKIALRTLSTQCVHTRTVCECAAHNCTNTLKNDIHISRYFNDDLPDFIFQSEALLTLPSNFKVQLRSTSSFHSVYSKTLSYMASRSTDFEDTLFQILPKIARFISFWDKTSKIHIFQRFHISSRDTVF